MAVGEATVPDQCCHCVLHACEQGEPRAICELCLRGFGGCCKPGVSGVKCPATIASWNRHREPACRPRKYSGHTVDLVLTLLMAKELGSEHSGTQLVVLRGFSLPRFVAVGTVVEESSLGLPLAFARYGRLGSHLKIMRVRCSQRFW